MKKESETVAVFPMWNLGGGNTPSGTLEGDGKGGLKAAAVQPYEVTWAALVALRDGGRLVPGNKYRITDYVTAVASDNAASLGKVFDIVVTANAANQLSEIAEAMRHEGSEDFANEDVASWKIWYCLDNDRDRFDWASNAQNPPTWVDDSGTVGGIGRGVIYRMVDGFDNDCPFDFKNITFGRWKVTGFSAPAVTRSADLDDIRAACVNYYVAWQGSDIAFRVANTTVLTLNVASDDFQYRTAVPNGGYSIHISPANGGKSLPNICILQDGANCITIGPDSTNITIHRSDAYNITVGCGCSRTIMYKVSTLRIGNSTTYNLVGYGSEHVLGDGCAGNILCGYMNGNELEIGCYNNVLGRSVSLCRLGPGCHGNYIHENNTKHVALGPECQNNDIHGSNVTLGPRCGGNNVSMQAMLGDLCENNTVGIRGTLGAYCRGNTVGDDVELGADCQNCEVGIRQSKLGPHCSNVRFGVIEVTSNDEEIFTPEGYFQNFEVGAGVTNVTVTCMISPDGPSGKEYCQNVEIKSGVHDTTISVPERSQEYHTVFQPANSRIYNV